MSYRIIYEGELAHHGILGQKWGVRRYQNPDGTLTDAGKKRYERDTKRINRMYDTSKINYNRQVSTAYNATMRRNLANAAANRTAKIEAKYGSSSEKANVARYNQKKAEAEAKKWEALNSKLKEFELKNLEDRTYASNRAAKNGKKVIKSILMTGAGVALAATTGVGFISMPTGKTTSYTQKQYEEAKKYADSVYWNAMPMPKE